MGEVFGDPTPDGNEGDGWSSGKWGLTQEGSNTAWARLGEILGESEAISDSESITTIGDLDISDKDGGLASNQANADAQDLQPPPRTDENVNDWEHMSPKEMRFLAQPGSPSMEKHRRRSSAGPSSPSPNPRSNSGSSPLRPVLSFGPELLEDDGIVIDDDEDEEEQLLQPLPTPKAGGIDEVRYKIEFDHLTSLPDAVVLHFPPF